MSFSAAKFMISLTAETIPKEAEIVKEWAEHYRTVKKRTARSETTKDKAGALPPVVCEKAKSGTWIGVSFPDSRVESLTTSVSHELVLRSFYLSKPTQASPRRSEYGEIYER